MRLEERLLVLPFHCGKGGDETLVPRDERSLAAKCFQGLPMERGGELFMRCSMPTVFPELLEGGFGTYSGVRTSPAFEEVDAHGW